MQPGQLAARLGKLTPGAKIALSLSRSDAIRVLDITLGIDPGHAWTVSVSPVATQQQQRNLAEWLTP